LSIPLDRRTYEQYRALPDGELNLLARQCVVRNPENSSDTLFGRIDLTPANDCPFLNAEHLCKIQQALGVEALSPACSIYPRALNEVQGVVEVSLYLSCPEAARQVLLDPEFNNRVAGENASWFHTSQFSRLAANGDGLIHKPYGYFDQVRQSITTLLRDRGRLLWQRVFLLGMLCKQLGEIRTPEQDAKVPAILAVYAGMVATGGLKQELEKVPAQPAAQLDTVLRLSDMRMQAGASGERFRDCVLEALDGVGYSPGAPDPDYSGRYLQAERQYFRPLMAQHPHMLENYLLNYTYRTLFPFGRQASAHSSPQDIYAEYLLLLAQFSMVQGLLIGLAGHYRERFEVSHVVKLIQAFSKAVEHNPSFLTEMTNFLAAHDLANPQGMVTLLKIP
jgi:lysine-N-methylase